MKVSSLICFSVCTFVCLHAGSFFPSFVRSFFHTVSHLECLTRRQASRQSGSKTESQTVSQLDRQTVGQTVRQSYRRTDSQSVKQVDRQTVSESFIQTTDRQSISFSVQKEPWSNQHCIVFTQMTLKESWRSYEEMLSDDEIRNKSGECLPLVGSSFAVLLRLLLTRRVFVSDGPESLFPKPNNPKVNFVTSLSQCTHFIKSRHVTSILRVVMGTNRSQLHFPEHVNSLHGREAIVPKHVKILGKAK